MILLVLQPSTGTQVSHLRVHRCLTCGRRKCDTCVPVQSGEITVSYIEALRQVKNLTHQNPEPLGTAASLVEEFLVAQELTKIVKLKCCRI